MQNKHPNSPTNLTVCTAGTHALRSETLRLVASRKTVIITFFFISLSACFWTRARTRGKTVQIQQHFRSCAFAAFATVLSSVKVIKNGFSFESGVFIGGACILSFLCFFVQVLRRIIWIFVICSSAPVFFSGQVSQ